MSYDFLSVSFQKRGKAKGLNILTCLSGFNTLFFFFFSFTGVGFVGFPSSLVFVFFSCSDTP